MDKPKAMEIYRHFKGGKYQIICIAENTETGKEEVVYRAMYEPFKIYARDLDMFMSPVDREKYPEAKQQNRFELYEGEEKITKEKESLDRLFVKKEQKTEETIEKKIEVKETSETRPVSTKPDADKSQISPALLKFLEVDGYEAQLDCLSEIKDELTPEILTSIEFSLGMEEAQQGSVMERYRGIKNYIMLKQKYERAHR